MFSKISLSLFVISCMVFDSNASIGPYNRPCKHGDIKCIATANMHYAIPFMADGLSEFGIRGLEPMNFKNITMFDGFFNLVFPAVKIFGSRQCSIVGVTTDVQQSTQAVTLDCPLEAIGKYVLSAKSYIFDINNEGNFVLHSDSIRTTIKSRYETIYGHDGKKYWNLIDYEYFYEPLDKLHIELGNLFSGDIESGQYFLNFMPNGWLVSVAKIGEPLVSSVVAKFHDVLKAVFLRLPIE